MFRKTSSRIRFVRAAGSSVALAAIAATASAGPTVFPTGTTIYDPDKAWNGYTIHDIPAENGSVLVDMNGNVVRRWPEMLGFPARILPGGHVMGGSASRPPHQENNVLVQFDWDGNEIWRFEGLEQIDIPDGETIWSARQHHDWQREGNPVGYYAPGAEPGSDSGRTLLLAHKNVIVPEISDKPLEDDYIVELSWDGEVLWEWLASDYVEQFGFSEDARNAIHRSATYNASRNSVDWLHINSASWVGPNRWYDAGDARFHPDNVIVSSRAANFVAIISRSGDVVWRIGPDFRRTPEEREIEQIIGQHHPHIIPEGLPGAGNLLVFDNGGRAGYGVGNPVAPNGVQTVSRIYSRVLEINPVTLEVVWQYMVEEGPTEEFRFFSWYVSSAQRLPNGNTLINEGAHGRLFEVTADKEIVWEYVNPFAAKEPDPRGVTSRIYRAYRVPYGWVPQLDRPEERRVVPPPNGEFRIEPR